MANRLEKRSTLVRVPGVVVTTAYWVANPQPPAPNTNFGFASNEATATSSELYYPFGTPPWVEVPTNAYNPLTHERITYVLPYPQLDLSF